MFLLILRFAILVAATSAAKVCKCEGKEVNKSGSFKPEYSIVIDHFLVEPILRLSSSPQEYLSFQKRKDFDAAFQQLFLRLLQNVM